LICEVQKMRKNNYAPLITGLIFFVMLFIFSERFIIGINSGLLTCVRIVIPSVFPFLIASSLTGYGVLPKPLKKLFEPITQFLFRLPAETVPAIIFGQLGGYLSGAKSAESLRQNGLINRYQAERLILFSTNAGMGFCVNAVGNAMLCSREAGRILLVSLCISALLTGIILKYIPLKGSDIEKTQLKPPVTFSSAVVTSVSSASYTMLATCGFVTLFAGVCEVTDFYIKNDTLRTAVTCLLEVTKGCIDLTGKTSLPVIASVCAFGGICIHLQIFSMSKINVFRFYLSRIIHAVSAYFICKIILYFNPIESPVFLSFSENAAPFSFSPIAAISLVFLSFLLISDLDNGKKIC